LCFSPRRLANASLRVVSMQTVNAHDAKTRLSQLLTAAEAGEDVMIARQGVAVARLVPIAPAKPPEPGEWRSLPGC